MRKTVDIVALTEMVNRMIAASRERGSGPEDIRGRIMLGMLLERVLFDSGRYAGFGYLGSECIPYDERVKDGPTLKPDYDDSARMYYVKPYRH